MPVLPPAMPECDRLNAVAEQSWRIGDFVEWLISKGYVIARWDEHPCEERLIPWRATTEKLLAEYYELDLAKIELERRALLEWLREQE